MSSHRSKKICLPLLLALALASTLAASSSNANPIDGVVSHGQAVLSQRGNTLIIRNSNGAIINWKSFSINGGETTQFIQPSSTSAVLNRVTGGDVSRILGSLQSNGRVFLINPNGVVFGQGSSVNVGGLVASTLAMSNQNFLAGTLQFDATPNAKNLNNQGNITTPSGGQVYLIAPEITNSGIITTPQGGIFLAAGKSVQILDTASPNIQYEVQAAANQVLNLGKLLAESGSIGIYAGVIQNSGSADADTVVRNATGKISFIAAQDITLQPGSTISASGKTNNAMDGGTVKVIAQGTLNMQPQASVQVDGGGQGGNGGALELSGKSNILLAGTYSGKANNPQYHGGSLTLDPYDINIVNGGTDTTTNGVVNSSDSPASTLNIAPTALAGSWTTVNLNATHDINLQSTLTDSDFASGAVLDLTAGNNININASIGTVGSLFHHSMNALASNMININAPLYYNSAYFLFEATNDLNVNTPLLESPLNPTAATFQGGLYAAVTGTLTLESITHNVNITSGIGTSSAPFSHNITIAAKNDINITGGIDLSDAARDQGGNATTPPTKISYNAGHHVNIAPY